MKNCLYLNSGGGYTTLFVRAPRTQMNFTVCKLKISLKI